MASYQLICKDGEIFFENGSFECSGSWEQQLVVLPKNEEITPEIVIGYFSAGFFLCTVPLMASLGVRYLLSTIRG